MIVNAGAHSVIADFNNIDDVGGNLMTMAQQVRSAVAWVYNNAAEVRRRQEPALRHRPFVGRRI